MIAHPSSAYAVQQRRASASMGLAIRPWFMQAPRRSATVVVRASSDVSPIRAALSQVAINVYKLTGAMAQPDTGSSPLWASIKKLDAAGVSRAVQAGANLNERDAQGDTPLLFIARQGHYKYPPSEIPQTLVKAGADMEAADKNGLTPLQVSLLSGWQNISELLIQSGASTKNVGEIKGRLTCPDCKRVVAKYNL